MIDLIEKLPDSIVGIGLAGLAWFGFNYTTLGERALERYGSVQSQPACTASLSNYQSSFRPIKIPKLGEALGMPELDTMLGEMVEVSKPRLLSAAEQITMCECAVAQTHSAMRFDYALHTASFRLFTPASLATLRSDTVKFVMSGACGALPEDPSRR